MGCKPSLLMAENQFIDFLIGPKFRLIECDAALVLSAQAERLHRVIVDVADIADAHKFWNVFQRPLVPEYDFLPWDIMPAVIHSGLHSRHVQVWVTGKNEVTANKITLIFCPLQKIQEESP